MNKMNKTTDKLMQYYRVRVAKTTKPTVTEEHSELYTRQLRL